MTQKSIKRNYIYNIILQVSRVLFPLVTAPYVARVLDPDGVGLFNFANTFSGYFALFAALGIPTYGIREIAKIRSSINLQRKLVSELISFSLITTFLCTVLYFLSLFFIPQLTENYIIFIVAGLTLYLTPFKIDWFFQGKEEFGYIAFRSTITKICAIIALFLFVHSKNDLIIYVAINAICSVADELWNYSKLFKLGIFPYLTFNIKSHFKPLLLLFSSVIAMSIYTILDTLMLGFLNDYSEVGYYNCATHISKAMIPIVTGLAVVAMPRLSYYAGQGGIEQINALLRKSLSVVAFLSFPITIGIFVVAPVFVPLFYGFGFMGAVKPLQIVIFTLTAIGFSNLMGIQVLIGLGKDKPFLFSVLFGTVSNFFLNLLFIPFMGAVGASISSVVAEVLVVISQFYLVKKYTEVTLSGLKEIVQCLLISLLFIPTSLLISQFFDNWLQVFVTIASCSLLYILLQGLLKNPTLFFLYDMFKKKQITK